MILPILLAAAVSASSPNADSPDPAATPARKVMTVHIPMPKFITKREELRFDIPYQIPELNWANQRFWDPYQSQRNNTKNWFEVRLRHAELVRIPR